MAFGSGVCPDSFTMALTAGLPPPDLGSLAPSSCSARRWGPVGTLEPWSGICSTWVSHRKAGGIWSCTTANRGLVQDATPKRVVWSSEKLGREVLCHQKFIWMTCRKGAKPRPVTSTHVDTSLSTIS